MQDAVYASLASNLGMHWHTKGAADFARTGNRHGGLAESPYNVYRTANGWIALICVGDPHWRKLTQVMGQPELASDPRLVSLKLRVEHMDLVDQLIGDWTSRFETQPLFEKLIAASVPCAPVRNLGEVMEDENMHARGALTRVDHPEFGSIVMQRSPLQYDGVPHPPLEPSHRLGADTRQVLESWTDLPAETIARIAAV
jgi:CoA:oxalate CoA-transferase